MAKTGRPPEDDSAAIQRMVDLRAADPTLKVRAAAREAAKQLRLKGQLSTHEERLRKRYTALAGARELPLAETRSDRVRRGIQQHYDLYEAGKARARADLETGEKEALNRGLDVSAPDLADLLRKLEREKDSLDMIVHASPEFAAAVLIEQRLSREEADAQFLASIERHKQVQEEIEIVRKIQHGRQALGIRG